MVKLAINGFGRIGRIAFRVALARHEHEAEVVAINTSGSMPASSWAHLLKYDTVYGKLERPVSAEDYDPPKKGQIGVIIVGGRRFPVLAEREPGKIPWSQYRPEVVIESTGVFRTEESAQPHLRAGAKRVLISAPQKGGNVGTFIIGVNADDYKDGLISSSASCTTNCIAPVAAVVNARFGVVKAMMTTIHAYTANQELVDGSHRDLRRARAAAANIVPTTTGAAQATTETIPELKGLFDGIALRVPVVNGSIADFTFIVGKKTTVEEVNQAFREAVANPLWKGIVEVADEPIVSSDIIGSSASAIVDAAFTRVVDGDMIKVLAWYDNEWGYACRLVEQAVRIGKTVSPKK